MSTCAEKGCTAVPRTRGRCERHYRQRVRMGIHGYRDAGPAREHIKALRGLGWTWEAIADAANLSTFVAHRINNGTTKHVWPESETAILSVPLTPCDSHRGVDSAGTRRRVQALAWMGWSCREVAERAGIKLCTLQTLIQPDRQLSYTLARKVAAVYDELCMTRGTNNFAAGKARKLGFLPPLAWDDDLIDLPDADLKAELVRRAVAMDDDEARRCSDAFYKQGDRSPLVAAGAREWGRRVDRKRRQAAA